MRPFILDPLFVAQTILPGVGPRNGKYLAKLTGGEKLIDLLWHKPVDVIDRRSVVTPGAASAGTVVTMVVTAHNVIPAPRRGLPTRVHCVGTDDVPVHLVFFNAKGDYLAKQLPIGEKRIVSGLLDLYRDTLQIVHPDYIALESELSDIARLEPVYPLTQGITNRVVGKAISQAVGKAPDLPEWQDSGWLKKQKWPSWRNALTALHAPEEIKDLDTSAPIRARLAYDELLANQLAVALIREKQTKKTGRSLLGTRAMQDKIMAAAGFALTNAQTNAIADIAGDMAAPNRMMRLLQGDVGSGKTIVAMLAMAQAIEAGAQAAIIAPTEILARQHEISLTPLAEAAGISIITLTGRDKGKKRDAILNQIKSGDAQIIIGTHAIFQDDVAYHDLGLTVIDEQHKFGVHQRLQLSSKGHKTDVLVMTATPIPRTLTLTIYGDMDVSLLNEKPPGRKSIDTRLMSNDRVDNLIDALERKIAQGARIYWVCPLVEESEKLDLAAAEERYDILQHRFGDRVSLVHGRMKAVEKDTVMNRFAAGDLDILVATTVIEVGVNVPEATVMIIEHAERFGLAQLHQLRGRVGRGGDQSSCILLYANNASDTARERLKVMRESEDGFFIAEKDLKLRGSGEILGTRQSGMPVFKLADLNAHSDLLRAARDDAKLVITNDPDLNNERGKALRTLLYLFERDQAIRYLESG